MQTAYRALKAFEGGLHLARGIAQARFLAEIRGVGILESEEEMAEALSLLKELLNSYPDNRLSAEATYAFSQVVYGWADAATEGEKLKGFDRGGLLDEVIHLMARFLGSHPKDPRRRRRFTPWPPPCWSGVRPKKRWRANHGAMYYHVYGNAMITQAMDMGKVGDLDRHTCGNYWKTEPQAQVYADACKALAFKLHEVEE